MSDEERYSIKGLKMKRRTPKILTIKQAVKIASTLNLESQFNKLIAGEMTKEDMLTLIELNRSNNGDITLSTDSDKDFEKEKIRLRKELVKIYQHMNDVSDLINFVSSYEA